MPSVSITQKPPAYYNGLNFIRGFLILLVILVHSLPMGMPVFVLYTFLMPLFLSVSGFLIRKDSLVNTPLPSLLQKYFFRLLLPWLLAYLCYELWFSITNQPLILFPEVILYPFFHLWFIPALLLMIFGVRSLEKLPVKCPDWVIWVVSLLFCYGWYIFYSDMPPEVPNSWRYYLGDKRLYGYFIFFYTGYLLRNRDIKVPLSLVLNITLGVLFFVLHLGNVYLQTIRPISFLPYLLFNLSLIYCTLITLADKTIIRSSLIRFCSHHSMAIYLYHYLILLSLAQFIKPVSHPVALLLFTCTTIVTLCLVYVGSSVRFINKFWFGNSKA